MTSKLYFVEDAASREYRTSCMAQVKSALLSGCSACKHRLSAVGLTP